MVSASCPFLLSTYCSCSLFYNSLFHPRTLWFILINYLIFKKKFLGKEILGWRERLAPCREPVWKILNEIHQPNLNLCSVTWRIFFLKGQSLKPYPFTVFIIFVCRRQSFQWLSSFDTFWSFWLLLPTTLSLFYCWSSWRFWSHQAHFWPRGLAFTVFSAFRVPFSGILMPNFHPHFLQAMAICYLIGKAFPKGYSVPLPTPSTTSYTCLDLFFSLACITIR